MKNCDNCIFSYIPEVKHEDGMWRLDFDSMLICRLKNMAVYEHELCDDYKDYNDTRRESGTNSVSELAQQ